MTRDDEFYEMGKYHAGDFPFVATTIGHVNAQPAVEHKDTWELNQIIWITEGEGLFKVEGETLRLTKGQGFFTRKYIPHSYTALGDCFATSWVTFSDGEPLLRHYDIGDWLIFDVPDFLEKSHEQLFSHCMTSKSLASRSAHAYLWATELFDAISIYEYTIVEKIQQFLDQNYSEPVTLVQLSEKMGMNKFSLCKLYRKETGETIMDTLKSMRIRRAKRLLRYGFDPVSEICKQCGYDGVSYFIKSFREETGFTPLQYRQKYK